MAHIKVTAAVRLPKKERLSSTLRSMLSWAAAREQQAEALVAKGHTICSYSKAPRRNIEVKLLANGKPMEGDLQ